MSAKDLYHDQVVHALQKDGWTITHDPLSIPIEATTLLVDLGAEQMVTAMPRIAHHCIQRRN